MEVDAYIAGPIAAGADPTDEQFRLLVQSVTDYAIFLLDSGGRVISWNDGAERIKGYSAGEIVGRPIALFYPPEDRDAGKPEQGLRCAEREGRFRTEGWRVRKDGSRFWADVAITALRDAHGGLRGFAKVTRDMTARHRERENEQRVAAMPPIVLGKDMADNLGATVGSVVLVTSPQGELTPFGMVPKYSRFRVVGIFNSGFFDYDSSWAFARLSDAQQLFGLGNLISVIEFKIDDIYRAPEIAAHLKQEAGRGFDTTNWMEQNKALFHALRLERLVTFITIGLIVFVAALNILISLIMMVMEKTKDIAVLMSVGTRRGQVRNVFMAQGVLIGVIGTAMGLILGYSIAYAGGHYHIISLSTEVYSIDYVPFAPRLMDGVLVTLVAVGVSFVATVYPSWSAARVLPAEALRYE